MCSKCEPLDDPLQQLCHSVGYNFTASFPIENGIRYQDKVYSDVSKELNTLTNCSQLSNLMVCSRYVPKCLENRKAPIFPCREVCEQFVQDCQVKLEGNNLKLLYTALCRLLPDKKANSSDVRCLKPMEFQRQSNVSVGNLPKCSVHQVCQQNNVSLISSGVLSNQCSEVLKRYACLNHTTPCIGDDNVPYRPCRAFCERVQKNCALEIAKLRLSFSRCSELPEKNSMGDLCKMESWPAPWPNTTKEASIIKCYCDTCGPNKNLCQTNGSCFIQSRLTIKGMITERTCLQPGKQQDFICHHNQDYSYAKCCRKDYCNRELQRMTTASTPSK
ncbi:hypothetical protein QZH41_011364 [Actinostola sp. cb2023]|nr:hypothetical protein QZH41_011364 [Actinostola sp. cb2023]